jgi:hypothetical protein
MGAAALQLRSQTARRARAGPARAALAQVRWLGPLPNGTLSSRGCSLGACSALLKSAPEGLTWFQTARRFHSVACSPHAHHTERCGDDLTCPSTSCQAARACDVPSGTCSARVPLADGTSCRGGGACVGGVCPPWAAEGLPPPYVTPINALLPVGAAAGLAQRFVSDSGGFAVECDGRTPLGGSVVCAADGSFVYTPPYGATGSDSLVARARGVTGLVSAPLTAGLLISGDPGGWAGGPRAAPVQRSAGRLCPHPNMPLLRTSTAPKPIKPAAGTLLPQLPRLSVLGVTLRVKGCEQRSLAVESTLLANDTLRLLTTAAAGGSALSTVAPNGATLQLTTADGVWLRLDPICTLTFGAWSTVQLTSPGVPATLALDDARRLRRFARCLKIPKRPGPYCSREFKARSRADGMRRRFLPGPWSADGRMTVVCDAQAAACT